MPKNLFEIEKKYLEKRHQGMEFSEMRKEMLNEGLDPEAVSIVIRSIDNKILNGEKFKVRQSNKSELFYVGLILLGFGVFFTAGTFMGWLGSGGGYILAYGPILGGFGLMTFGNRRK